MKKRELTRLLISSSFRWMGSTCAVYALEVQAKAERGAERSSTVKRRNRRWKRAGVKRNRKQRHVTVSAPEPSPTLSSRGGKFARMCYLTNRRENWQKKRVGEIKYLINLRSKLSRNDVRKEFLGRSILLAKKRWAACHALSTKGSLFFSKIVLDHLLTITEESWSTMSRGPDAPVNRDAYRAVPPPPELTRKKLYSAYRTPRRPYDELDDGESSSRPVVAKARKRYALREAAYQPPVLPERKQKVPIAKKRCSCVNSPKGPCRTCSGERIKRS
jgi:hypothetical protein